MSEAAISVMARIWPWGIQIAVLKKIIELQILEAWQNAFILIYRCEIYPCYEHILFTWKSKCSRSCCFYQIIFFLISFYHFQILKLLFSILKIKIFINHNRLFRTRENKNKNTLTGPVNLRKQLDIMPTYHYVQK